MPPKVNPPTGPSSDDDVSRISASLEVFGFSWSVSTEYVPGKPAPGRTRPPPIPPKVLFDDPANSTTQAPKQEQPQPPTTPEALPPPAINPADRIPDENDDVESLKVLIRQQHASHRAKLAANAKSLDAAEAILNKAEAALRKYDMSYTRLVDDTLGSQATFSSAYNVALIENKKLDALREVDIAKEVVEKVKCAGEKMDQRPGLALGGKKLSFVVPPLVKDGDAGAGGDGVDGGKMSGDGEFVREVKKKKSTASLHQLDIAEEKAIIEGLRATTLLDMLQDDDDDIEDNAEHAVDNETEVDNEADIDMALESSESTLTDSTIQQPPSDIAEEHAAIYGRSASTFLAELDAIQYARTGPGLIDRLRAMQQKKKRVQRLENRAVVVLPRPLPAFDEVLEIDEGYFDRKIAVVAGTAGPGGLTEEGKVVKVVNEVDGANNVNLTKEHDLAQDTTVVKEEHNATTIDGTVDETADDWEML